MIPEEVEQGWQKREGAVIFTTVSSSGVPNSIYVLSIQLDNNGLFVIADNYFDKTKQNIEEHSEASLLFLTEEGSSYQIKGSIAYYTSGPYFEYMKSWNPSRFEGRAAVVLTPKQIFSGSKVLKSLD